MALNLSFKDVKFGIGDKIRVSQSVKEGDKTRSQHFEGTVIAIKGSPETRTFTVRKVGEQNIGIEKIFPINAPTITSVSIIKKLSRGTRRAKIYYIRNKSKRQIDKIGTRSTRRK
jgi:large subunit ribosomal protein L19